MKTLDNTLRYCANANALLTKTGLPALFAVCNVGAGEAIELYFRGISVSSTLTENNLGTVACSPTSAGQKFYNAHTIVNLVKVLMTAQDIKFVTFTIHEAHNDIYIHNAPANIAALFAAATMLSATRFSEVQYHD